MILQAGQELDDLVELLEELLEALYEHPAYYPSRRRQTDEGER